MKLLKIFRFELAYLVRDLSTWLYLAVLILFTAVIDALTTPGDGVFVNNTFHITATVIIGCFIWLIMGASIAGEAAARDVQTRIYPLSYVMPVTKLDYLAARFLAAFSMNAMLMLSLPLGILISFYLPGFDQPGFGPFTIRPYLSVYFFIALPNAFIATAIQFAFAALSRTVMTSYLATFLLAVFAQIIALAVAKFFGNWDLLILLDPVGVAGLLGNELQKWTPADKNTRLVTLEGMFLLNRILWLSVAGGSMLFTYLRFNFSNAATRRPGRFRWLRKKQPAAVIENAIERTKAISVPQVYARFSFATSCRQTGTIALTSFSNIAKNPAGLTVVAAAALISTMFADRIMTQFGIPLHPTTQQVLLYFASPLNSISTWSVIPLLIIFFAGQLIWSERNAELTDIADATPVPEWALFAGKFLALGLMILVWMTFILIAATAMQVRLGSFNIEWGLYVIVLFGLQFTDYLLFALLALVVHALVHQKYVAHLVMLLVFLFMVFPSAFGVEHNMLVFGAGPAWAYTDMRGFGNTLAPWLWFKLYWMAWALLLAVSARLLWVRGREHDLRSRFRAVMQRFTTASVAIATSTVAALIMLASFIFYNTNVLNDYQTAAHIMQLRAEYERSYGRYANTPQPELSATKLDVQIFPDEPKVEIRGTYTLVNRDLVRMDSIHVTSISGKALDGVKLNRPATCIVNDHELGHYIYKLHEGLRPGDSLLLNFQVNHRPSGFSHNGSDQFVVENGTYFTNYDLLPSIGYQRQREIKDPVNRKKYELPARTTIPSLYDITARKKSLMTNENTFEAIVGTSNSEIAIAPGNLIRTWTKADRQYFHYKTDAPIGNEFAIASGRYAMKEGKWNNVAIKIYYHARHAQNIDRMFRSVRNSLDYFTEHFGPYPYGHITIVERAGLGTGASADASFINYGEQYSLLKADTSKNGFELPYYILAHEVAHQWWGLARLTPANVEGAGVLIESLAVYSGMLVLKKNYGDNHLQRYVEYLHSSYEVPRSLASAPLLQANESFLYYRKGGLAMYALSRYIGEDNVNAALRNLLSKRASGEQPLPTTLDLYRELEAITPDTLNYLLHDLFKTNTYWRLKTKQVSATQKTDGNWQVSLKVEAQKLVVDSTGKETEVAINDWLEVGVYENDNKSNTPMYLKMHRMKSREQTISVTVPRKPERAGIDPNYLMITIRRDGNVKYVEGL
jgi:ABC-2 type transport system permease protein